MATFDHLYHWTPTENRLSITREGLKPYMTGRVCTGGNLTPYLCFGLTPSGAWGLSGDMEWVSEVESWDLWQVQLPAGAEVHVRPFFGNTATEIKSYTAIPPDHLWFVAERKPAVFLDAETEHPALDLDYIDWDSYPFNLYRDYWLTKKEDDHGEPD